MSNNAYVGRDRETFTIRQSQQFVVIQYTVQVLNPLRINISIKDNPVTLVQLTW